MIMELVGPGNEPKALERDREVVFLVGLKRVSEQSLSRAASQPAYRPGRQTAQRTQKDFLRVVLSLGV